MDQLDSLEDWIAIRDNPFLEDKSQRAKLRFSVSWDDAEKKVVIDCRRVLRAPNTENGFSRSASFTLNEISAIHNQLSLVHASLGPYLPALPEEPHGLWSLILSNNSTTVDYDRLCEDIHRYLSVSHEICGEHLLTDTLFEVHSLDEYFEKISELRRRSYDEAVKRADEKLRKVLSLRCGSINMLDMFEVYKLEDEAIFQWNVALAELYNYLIQPFLDVRAPALEKLMEARRGLEEMQWGRESQETYASILSEWQTIYVHALDSIQDLYTEYYGQTVTLISDAKDRMLSDKNKFGQKSFEVVAKERFIRVSEDLCGEKIQLFQNVKKNYENQCDKIKQEIASLDDCPGMTERELAALERKAYEYQVKVYDSHLDILLEEENLVRLKMNIIKQEIAELADEVTFYDAVENPEDLDEFEDELIANAKKSTDPRLKRLERKIVMICRKKAAIRNKKKSLIEEKNLKLQKKRTEGEKIRHHHNIQLKRDENKAELKQKQDFIEEERRKTVERLKQYRMKYATPSTIKPQRCQPLICKQRPVRPANTKASPVKSKADDNEAKLREKAPEVSDRLGTQDDKDSIDAAKSNISESSEMNLLRDGSAISAPAQLAPSSVPPPPLPPPPPPPPPSLPPPAFFIPSKCKSSEKPREESSSNRPDGIKLNGAGLASPGPAVDLRTIQNAKERLRRMDPPADKPVSAPFISMMQLINQREKLRPVKPSCESTDGTCASSRVPSSNDHLRHLQEALERISRSTRPDENESDLEDDDFQDFE